MSRVQKVPNGTHPSGALICQICGSAAALEAERGPDHIRLRRETALVCLECSTVETIVAERFRLRLTLRGIQQPTVRYRAEP